jgi:hypothetical protein
VGPNTGDRMEPQNTKQNKMHKTTKNNTKTNPTQLGDNLNKNTKIKYFKVLLGEQNIACIERGIQVKLV